MLGLGLDPGLKAKIFDLSLDLEPLGLSLGLVARGLDKLVAQLPKGLTLLCVALA